jgi:molybdopterin/thiamine biosynthesis adenylyltransferase
MTGRFSYEEAFDRNLGWFTEAEQQTLRNKTIAIAGMGGVGGVHLLTLARLGVGGFHIADLDSFELANFNRQVGATMSSLGEGKTSVLARMTKDINPEVRLVEFSNGVTDENLEAFLSGVDLFIDGFDFFAIGIRRKAFQLCRRLGIPAVTAAPIGMGVAFLAFVPDGMSFEDYFRFENRSELRQYVNFLLGLTPKAMHRAYLVDPARVDIANKKGPSTIIGVQLCASFTAAQVVKMLLHRGAVRPAPYHYHFDAYLNRFRTHRSPGNNGFLQRLKGNAVERAIKSKMARES